jgi:predicted transposase YdaD
MSSLVFDISHTRFYKDVEDRVGEKAKQEGKQEGEFTGKLKLLQEMLDEGTISQETFDRKVEALKNLKPAEGTD